MAAMHREILLVSPVDIITNPQLRHHVELRVGGPKIDEDPEAPRERRGVGGFTAEPLSRAGLPTPAISPLRFDLDRNPMGIIAITREQVDARHVARERNRISASAVYLGSHEQLPGASHLLVGQLHWSRSPSVACEVGSSATDAELARDSSMSFTLSSSSGSVSPSSFWRNTED